MHIAETETISEIDDNQLELSLEEWYEICQERPDAFAHYYFDHIIRVPSSRFHFLLYTLIKKVNETAYDNYIAIAAPRGNAKTQIMSIILPIWCAAFERKNFIILISETGRLAEACLESIKHELTTNAKLERDFPHIFGEGKVWRKEAIDIRNEVRIVALGSGKQIRGHQKKGGHRPDLVLIDEVSSDEAVRTKARRDELENWFTKAVMGMKGADSKMDIIVTGTIIHPKCLLSKLLDPLQYPGWQSHKFKAVYKFSNSPLWREWEKIYINQEDEFREENALAFFERNKEEMLEGTEVLWPEGDSYYNLMKYRIDSGRKAFQSEKQNQSIDPSTVLFDMSKVVYYDKKDLDISKLEFYGAIDPASGDAKSKGDASAIITIAKDVKTGILYVWDALIDSGRVPSQCIKYIKQMHKTYNYKKFGVDNDTLKLLKDLIIKEVPDLQSRLALYDLRIKKGKRIDRLEPVVHSGILRFQKNQVELLGQVELYPNVDHDDGLDALEIAARVSGHRKYRILTF